MNKMSMKEQAEVRANLYGMAEKVLNDNGYYTEPIKGGMLIDIGNGRYAKMSVSICDSDKVDKWREEYAESMAKKADKAEAKAERERLKAEKAAKRVEKVKATEAIEYNSESYSDDSPPWETAVDSF